MKMPNEKHMLCCEIKFFNFHYNKFLKSHIVEKPNGECFTKTFHRKS